MVSVSRELYNSAQMGIHNISMGCQNRQKENWVTEDLMGIQVQESSRTVVRNNQKLVGMEYIHTISVNAASLGISHLVIKHLSSLRFHQVASALMGLVRLVYLFNFVAEIFFAHLLGAFTKLHKVTVSFVISVCPYGTTRLPLGWFL